MKLIADSGSTYTDWIIIHQDKITTGFKTKGLNPYFTNTNEIRQELAVNFPKNIDPNSIHEIYFYGAGCSSNINKEIVSKALNLFFLNAISEINTDLLAAARSLFFNDSGIVVILGTGANTGYYDGRNIQYQIPSLGYILGDEGGGDYLGKLFITELLYSNLPENIELEFKKEYGLNNQELMNKIYKEPNPNTFLASICEFITKYKNSDPINKIIIKSFDDLFKKHIVKYKHYKKEKIRVSGSIGHYFRSHLLDVARLYQVNIELIDQYPINRLAEFHITNK